MAHADFVRGQIFHDDGASADNREFADNYSGSHKYFSAEPSISANHNGSGDERHSPAHEVMCAGAEMAILAEVRTIFEGDGGEVVEGHVRPDHAVCGEREIFRENDFRGRKNHDGFSNIRAEAAQEPAAEIVERARTPAEESRLDK